MTLRCVPLILGLGPFGPVTRRGSGVDLAGPLGMAADAIIDFSGDGPLHVEQFHLAVPVARLAGIMVVGVDMAGLAG